MACCSPTARKILKSMWFFNSKSLMTVSIVVVLIFITLNVAIFFHDYDYWIRSYQFVISLVFLVSSAFIIWYWKSGMQHPNESESFKLITAPIIAMTIFMAVGSIFGYLHFFYFKAVFAYCDRATEAEQPWQTASDFVFYVTLMASLGIYPVFVFGSYLNPLEYRWRWLFYLVTSTLVILFTNISLEEAYHTYAHLCDNQYVEDNKLCPTMVAKHHYKCESKNFTSLQRLWLEMEEQVIGPGVFLVIAEYIPLLFALIWMAPVRSEKQKIRTSIKFFEHPHDTFGVVQGAPLQGQDTTDQENSFGMFEANADGDGTHKKITKAPPENKPASKPIEILIFLVSCTSFFVILIRLGLLLNHVGRYPKAEILLKEIGHLVSALTLCAVYAVAYFFWLRKQNTKVHRPGEEDEHNEHHMAHARFDAFLLKIASALITVQILLTGVVELDFTRWLTAFFILHKIPVIASVWLQYTALKKALTLECNHWTVAGRQSAMILAIAALNANFLEWVAQFVMRRFTVFVLDEPDNKITPIVVAAISISEILYPALSFYYFHALLCWLVVFWRVLKAAPSNRRGRGDMGKDQVDAAGRVKYRKKRQKKRHDSAEFRKRTEVEDIAAFMDSA